MKIDRGNNLVQASGRRTYALYIASIVGLPPVVAFAASLVFLVHHYMRLDFYVLGLKTPLSALAEDGITVLGSMGPIGIMLIVIGNVATFGILIAVCLIASRHWNPKRVYCMLACGLIVGIALGRWPWQFGGRLEAALPGTYGHPFPSWDVWVWMYNPIALLAIPIGALIAMLPIFKPGARYWLARGMCPKCQYDLRGSPGGVEAGCPECGWNRKPAPTAP